LNYGIEPTINHEWHEILGTDHLVANT